MAKLGLLAVLFSWHGYGQDTAAFRGELAFNPDQDPAQGVVIITAVLPT